MPCYGTYINSHNNRTQAFIMNQMKKNKSKDCVSVIQAINNWIIVKVLLLVAQLLICMYSASVQDLTCVTAIIHVQCTLAS